MMGIKRLNILKASLEKKEKLFNEKIGLHIADVKSANGQPLNDKRNGHSTMKRWDNQDRALRTLNEGIELTKRAIEKEEWKMENIKNVTEILPKEILKLIKNGEIEQWWKYPHIFFVVGVERARIIYDKKKGTVSHKYVEDICRKNIERHKITYSSNETNKDKNEQYKKFATVFNKLSDKLNKK